MFITSVKMFECVEYIHVFQIDELNYYTSYILKPHLTGLFPIT